MVHRYVVAPTDPPPNPTQSGGRLLAPADQLAALDAALCLVRNEYLRAAAKFPPFNSAHEGYAVLAEEVDELWHEVKRNWPQGAREEAVQVAAMAVRFLLDVK